jgi:DNA topoisomerase-1
MPGSAPALCNWGAGLASAILRSFNPRGPPPAARQYWCVPARQTTAPPEQSAREAGLVYVSDERPGIRRIQHGRDFKYVNAKNQEVRDPVTLGRIKRLAIPPAWSEVWISPRANGHLQATGRDAKNRKQYRYHPHWREVRDGTKYDRMIEFGKALPGIRRRVEADLAKPGLPREKVLATVIKILETGLIRVGNDEYARANGSFGLTTMRDRHVDVTGARIRFQFRGKSGKSHSIDLEDRRLARIVAGCQSIPGQELFQYFDDAGRPRDITSSDVNEYLREISKANFTAKDFRTWGGTVLAAEALRELAACETKKQAKKNVKEAIEAVSQRLGNTPTICRKCYVHPVVIEAYLQGVFADNFPAARRPRAVKHGPALKPEEAALLAFLEKQSAAQKRDRRATLVDKLAASLKHRRAK